jgi:hypothetical protein
MFIAISISLLIVSFLLALRSLKTFNEKPDIKDVKKSLDKDRIIFQSHSSSE